jgi:hypothetical protein
MRVPRVLIVSPVASHPANQGNAARINGLAQGLAARGVHCEFLYHTAEGMTAVQEQAMRAAWPVLHVNHAERRGEPGMAGSWRLDDWCPPSLTARVAALQRARRFDAVLVNYVWLSGAFLGLPDPPPLRILDTHDLFGDRRAVAIAAGLDPSWFFTTIEEEGRGLARADLVIAIQDEEAGALMARGARRVLRLLHAAPPRFLTGPSLPAPRIAFGVLASGNPWNLAAVTMLDAALCEGAPIDWLVAGSLLGRLDAGQALRSRPYRMEQVASPADFYDQVACVLVPNTDGTGLKIKTVEGLMSGRPVLGTAHAFAGLNATHAAHRAPDAQALAALARRHAADAGFRDEVAQATRHLALRVAADVAVQQDALAAAIRAGLRG